MRFPTIIKIFLIIKDLFLYNYNSIVQAFTSSIIKVSLYDALNCFTWQNILITVIQCGIINVFRRELKKQIKWGRVKIMWEFTWWYQFINIKETGKSLLKRIVKVVSAQEMKQQGIQGPLRIQYELYCLGVGTVKVEHWIRMVQYSNKIKDNRKHCQAWIPVNCLCHSPQQS